MDRSSLPCSWSWWSEEGALARDAVPAWKALGAGVGLTQRLIIELLVDQPLGHQAQLAERLGGPAGRPPGVPGPITGEVLHRGGGVVAGRFRDDQPAPGFEQGSGALCYHGGPAEGSSQDPVEMPPDSRVPACRLCSLPADRDPGLQAQTPDRVGQEGRPTALSVEEDEDGCGPLDGDDEAGEASPRAEVQEDRRGGAVRPELAADSDEALGVAEVGVDGARPEEARGPGLLEDGEKERRSGPGGPSGIGRVGGARGLKRVGERRGGGGVGAGHRRIRTPGR